MELFEVNIEYFLSDSDFGCKDEFEDNFVSKNSCRVIFSLGSFRKKN